MVKNYDEALMFLRNDNSGKSFFSGEKSDVLLIKAEKVLALKFSLMYKRFLSEFGAGNFGPIEFLGVIDETFEESCVPDCIWYTLIERQNSNLPNNLIVIYETGDGDLYCQDYCNVDDSEPKIVLYSPGLSNKEQTYEIVANNFGDFLIEKLNSISN
jgi:hypothetical protein